ncbi:hypothetical protein K501DRAFT_335326 [Backusella circina FSU 941]|nr:hypothetical protein K501DRAFT_335326 [Backusella circina FSU 941]
MQTKRTRQSKPKLFQCTGFGDCRMVFTRSEHLARHSRKHTGEKPFKCIVPSCPKSFSRFDNMMQHTQTHRAAPPSSSSPKNSNKKSTAVTQTRSSARVQKPLKKESRLTIKTTSHSPVYPGLVSPVSLSSCNDESDYDDDIIISPPPPPPQQQRRRLSIAELCNPPKNEGMPDVQLTKDEFEALEGFGRFRHTPSVFLDSLRDLASIANIDYC